jgi:hypothetical protein
VLCPEFPLLPQIISCDLFRHDAAHLGGERRLDAMAVIRRVSGLAHISRHWCTAWKGSPPSEPGDTVRFIFTAIALFRKGSPIKADPKIYAEADEQYERSGAPA